MTAPRFISFISLKKYNFVYFLVLKPDLLKISLGGRDDLLFSR